SSAGRDGPTVVGARAHAKRDLAVRRVNLHLLAAAHRAPCLEVVLPLAQRLTLVPLTLASREGDLDLGPPVEEVQRERHDRQALLAHARVQARDLLAVQQELALASRGVVGPRALRVLGDVHALEPRLTAVDGHEAVDERGPTRTQRLDLGAGEHDACLVDVLDRVVVPRLAVGCDEVPLAVARHGDLLESWTKKNPETLPARAGPTERLSPGHR